MGSNGHSFDEADLEQVGNGATQSAFRRPIWKDWCPLCGSRFQADNPEGLVQKITDHVDSGYCESHFRSLDVVMADDRY